MKEEEMDEVGNDVDAALTLLWKQFIQDVTQKVPNRKSMDDNSYCKLTEEIQANLPLSYCSFLLSYCHLLYIVLTSIYTVDSSL